ncbi:hypothetical protein [Treponema putidum]|uniref:Uncharacterized protein n=1 Tax=Treponema putidum TaxID=221027 RepID=A0AAE9SIC0_9SPIR|nr:hypothetical protein [Treponema putidum]UTY27864.1 hypothetical protein E4N76_01860 [Treponema putidum]UTY32776.1 hypothetical protein E4N74_01210 [Treponema putidum]
MRTGLKVLISLVISLAVFIGLLLLTVSDYESFIETKVYKPAIVRYINDNLADIEESFKNWNETNLHLFKSVLNEQALMSAAKQDQSQSDIEERDNIISKIISTVPGFIGLRIIDSQYQKMHFSTFPEDILTKTDSMLSYRRYDDTELLIPYQHIEVPDNGEVKITAITEADTILYCLPFYDSYDVYRGTAVFYISGSSFLYRLISDNILSISDGLALLSDETHTMLGILTETNNIISPDLKDLVLSDWERLPQSLRLISLDGKDSWVLVTKKTDFGYIGRITEKNVFMFPIAVKYFLIFTVFVTVFLMFFLLLNIKRNRLFIAQNKIQQLHWSILKNYLKTSQKRNWDELQKELEYHRHEVNAEIKKGLGKKLLQRKEKEIDAILQKNWQEIFDIINKTAIAKSSDLNLKGIQTEELISLLIKALKDQQIISEKNNTVSGTEVLPKGISEVQEAETVEELDEVQEAEAVEDLEEVQEAETVEELEEVQEAEPVEELDEVEDAPAVEDLEEVQEAESVEDIDEVQEAETVEELEEVQEAEPVEELDEVEDTAAVEELEEVQEAETVEDLEEVQEVEAVEDLDEVVDAPAVEELDEVQKAEPVEELDEEKIAESKIFDKIEKSKVATPLDEDEEAILAESTDDPMLRLNDLGYTISGLDFSELDISISELEKTEAKKVEYIDEDYSPARSMWGKYDQSPVLDDLDVVGDSEPMPLIDINDEQTIVNEDGVFVIRKTESAEPKNKDFKALVDSVLR